MRRLSRAAVVLTGIMVTSLLTAQVVVAASSDENDFYSKINYERSSRGVPTLSWSDSLAQIARQHSQEMANNDSLYHNDNLGNEVQGWQVVGENVGEGDSVDDLHQAFMNSAPHRSNILDTDYTEVGVGTAWKNGTLWVTEDFERPQSQSQSYTPSRQRPDVAPVPYAPASSNISQSGGQPATSPKKAPAPVRQPQVSPTPAADLTRQMVDHLATDDPAVGSVGGVILGEALGTNNSGDIISISFRPFADIVARVNRALLGH
ncbi:MAG: CAP domain-containing protein [Actinomycetota bacterium]